MNDAVSTAGRRLFAAMRTPQEIVFGSGQRAAIAAKASRLGTRVFVCVDPFLLQSPEIVEILEQLEQAGLALEVFSDVVPELPTASVQDAAERARAHGADLFLAIGGGSSIDLAKVAACLLTHGGVPSDYYGEFVVPGPVVPIIAVPTTAGTGSEVTPVAVLTDPARTTKIGISSPYLIPTVAICDPELTLTCPPKVTASAGADALAHCIEAYTSTRREPSAALTDERVFVGRGELTDEFARTGIRALARGLAVAYHHPDDLDAREWVMFGSLMGGLAFGTAGTAAAHALQYPIGAATHTPHGVGVGLLLPYVMAFNAEGCEHEFAEIARLFGIDGDDEAEVAAQAPAAVQAFLTGIGIPQSLADIGFDSDRLDWALEQGRAAVRLSENNPRPLDDSAAIILLAAYRGDLGAFDAHDDHEGAVA